MPESGAGAEVDGYAYASDRRGGYFARHGGWGPTDGTPRLEEGLDRRQGGVGLDWIGW